MARIRTVKPDLFLDDDLGQLSMVARYLYVGMILNADKAGRLDDRPVKLKACILPYDDVDIVSALDELASRDYVFRYEVDGRSYLQIRSWERHQKPHPREQESTRPAMPADSPAFSRPSRARNESLPGSAGQETNPCPAEPGKAGTDLDLGSGSGILTLGSGSGNGEGVCVERQAHAVSGENIWDEWRLVGARYGHHATAMARGVNIRANLGTIQELVCDRAELTAALECWWSSPHITAGRNIGLFASALPEVLAHLASGHPYHFRDPKPPKPAPARSAWCAHTPECSTQAEHLRRSLDEERARQGIAPREAVAS